MHQTISKIWTQQHLFTQIPQPTFYLILETACSYCNYHWYPDFPEIYLKPTLQGYPIKQPSHQIKVENFKVCFIWSTSINLNSTHQWSFTIIFSKILLLLTIWGKHIRADVIYAATHQKITTGYIHLIGSQIVCPCNRKGESINACNSLLYF